MGKRLLPPPVPVVPRRLALQADVCEFPSPIFSGAEVLVTRAMLCVHHTQVRDAGQSCSGFSLNAPHRLVHWALHFVLLAKGRVSGFAQDGTGREETIKPRTGNSESWLINTQGVIILSASTYVCNFPYKTPTSEQHTPSAPICAP